jgi:Lon protease-like protein
MRFDDCGWLANRWCEILPLPLELKQRLMQLDNPLVRLELVSDILAQNRYHWLRFYLSFNSWK